MHTQSANADFVSGLPTLAKAWEKSQKIGRVSKGFDMRSDDQTVRRYEQRTIGEAIRLHAELRPEYPAIVASGFKILSYRELQDQIDTIGIGLRNAGFDRNSRIVVALENSPEAALAIVAVACFAVAVPLDPKLTVPEVEKHFALVRPNAVLLRRGSNSVVRDIAEHGDLTVIEVIVANDGKLRLEFVVPQVGARARLDYADPNDPAFILQTSGTLADAKLIPYSHHNMLAAAERLRVWYELTPLDRCLSVTPLPYAHALQLTVFTPLLTGGSVAFPLNSSKVDLSEWLGALMPTWYSAGPTLHLSILEQMESQAGAKSMHALRFIVSSGASLPQKVNERLQSMLGVHLLEQYGASETSAICTNLLPPGRSKLGTCGVPWPDNVLIMGDDGRQLPTGDRGEILVGGPTVISGYLNAQELNRTRFADGWFKTGDIGSLDEDGFLTLHGRNDDLINRGGEKISPVEIDDALMRHPAIAEAAAFAVPHPRRGEDVAAAVVLRSGVNATSAELRKYLGEKLSTFKVPRRIIVVDQLPKGTTGKVLRRQLRESLSTELAVGPATLSSSINSKLLFQLSELWEGLLNSGPLTVDDDFFEKGGDSLLAEEMLCEVERLTGKAVPSSILFEAATIRQLARKLSEGDGLKAKPLIQLSSNGSLAPLFFFHGDYLGGGTYVRKLASFLGSDQPLLVIAPNGIDGERIPHSIEAMAADRLPVIKNAQPQGPYRLAGFCIGGLVAFEAARLLVARGEKVEMVAMIDSPAVNARRSTQTLLSFLARARPLVGPIVERAMVWTWYRMETFDRLSNLPLSQRWAWLKNKARVLVAAGYDRIFLALRPNGSGVMDRIAEPKIEKPFGQFTGRTREISRANLVAAGNAVELAMSNYLPAPLAVRVIYFSGRFCGSSWLRISSDLELITLAADHESVIREPSNLAHHLRGQLQRKREINP